MDVNVKDGDVVYVKESLFQFVELKVLDMFFFQFLVILNVCKKVVLFIFVGVVFLVIVLSFLFFKKYKVEVSVVIDVKLDLVLVFSSFMVILFNFIVIQIDILMSDCVVLKVICDFKLVEVFVFCEQWQEDGGDLIIEQFFIEVLQFGFDVKLSCESNVIMVLYKSWDLCFLVVMVNVFVQVYIFIMLEF